MFWSLQAECPYTLFWINPLNTEAPFIRTILVAAMMPLCYNGAQLLWCVIFSVTWNKLEFQFCKINKEEREKKKKKTRHTVIGLKNHGKPKYVPTSKIMVRAFRVKCGARMVNTWSTTCRNRLEGLVNRLSNTSVNTSTQWGSSEIYQETTPLLPENVRSQGRSILVIENRLNSCLWQRGSQAGFLQESFGLPTFDGNFT